MNGIQNRNEKENLSLFLLESTAFLLYFGQDKGFPQYPPIMSNKQPPITGLNTKLNTREDVNGWIRIRIGGEPYARGYQHGSLVAPEIGEALRVVKYLIYWNTGATWDTFVQAAVSLFQPKLEDEYAAEIRGIAEGCSAAGVPVSFQDILTWNAYPELICNWWPNHPTGKLQKNRFPAHHCSAFIATGDATVDGNIVFAHTTWQLYAASDSYNLILDITPATGHRIVMQSVPGYIHSSTDFAMTAAGLAITETTLGGFDAFDPAGLPEFQRMRKATQYANTIDEWSHIMQRGNNGGYGNSWLLGEISTGRIGRLELGLKCIGWDTLASGYFTGFNSATNIELRDTECGGDPGYWDIRKASGARRVRWMQLMNQHFSRIDREIAREMISDTYDVYLQKQNPSYRTIDGHLELDPQQFGGNTAAFYPWGSAEGKLADAKMIASLDMEARWGHPCGTPFMATEFIEKQPQYDWLRGYMKDRPVMPWTFFGS